MQHRRDVVEILCAGNQTSSGILDWLQFHQVELILKVAYKSWASWMNAINITMCINEMSVSEWVRDEWDECVDE